MTGKNKTFFFCFSFINQIVKYMYWSEAMFIFIFIILINNYVCIKQYLNVKQHTISINVWKIQLFYNFQILRESINVLGFTMICIIYLLLFSI